MSILDLGRRRLFAIVAAVAALILVVNLLFVTGNDVPTKISNIPISGRPTKQKPGPTHTPTRLSSPSSTSLSQDVTTPAAPPEGYDAHPIATLMKEADQKFRDYESGRSMTFRQTVEKYRSKYGRHPPPRFKDWYKYARKKNTFNIDDFEQVMDDLRPFWAIEPRKLRQYTMHMWEDPNHGVAGIHIRNHKVAKLTNIMWRSETLKSLIQKFVEYLPDMDIMMNRLDQPRVVVPWDDMQKMLDREYQNRSLPPEAVDSFTDKQDLLTNLLIEKPEEDTSERLEYGWFGAPGQQYMKIASQACPPESPARANMSTEEADALYKSPHGRLVSNFNLSSDLCTAGPAIQWQHGFLYSSSSVLASHTLVPVFGECKVNVNSDILFPANMYWKHDERYDYSDKADVAWEEKLDSMIWRGVTSGGVQIPENWSTMHRQRLVQLMNGSHMALEGREVTVMTQPPIMTDQSSENATYENFHRFQPSVFANNHTDIGFVEAWGCIPGDCPFYNDVFSFKPQVSLTDQFRSKYLIDVDGHSFSGRWRAFLESKALGFKATIFKEWHDSRLFAWRHFVPVDNRYDDLYSLLTYFVGYGKPGANRYQTDDYGNADVYIPAHDAEAKKLANQGRDWANKVLRRDDIEVYMFRLLIEYARIIDDNRDRIGYSGDGSELDKFDEGAEEGSGSLWGLGKLFSGKGNSKPDLDTAGHPVEESPGSRLGNGIGFGMGDG